MKCSHHQDFNAMYTLLSDICISGFSKTTTNRCKSELDLAWWSWKEAFKSIFCYYLISVPISVFVFMYNYYLCILLICCDVFYSHLFVPHCSSNFAYTIDKWKTKILHWRWFCFLSLSFSYFVFDFPAGITYWNNVEATLF